MAEQSERWHRPRSDTALEPRPASPRRRDLSPNELVEGILRRDRAILGKAMTLVESSHEADYELAETILESCLPHSGRSVRVGITGVPGAGKSSVIESLGTHLITEFGQTVAVLAVDPSSQISGGSILGDKTRMERLALSDMAFVRPSPSRGTLGGVAQRSREVMLLCEAAGYRNILVETVGVGQSEVAVHDMVDFFLLLGLTRTGDGLQGIKRGVVEFADVIAINKADGDNRQAAEEACKEFQNALQFLPVALSGWAPRALTCSARTGEGIAEIWNFVQEYVSLTQRNGWFARARQQQTQLWMREIVETGLQRKMDAYPHVRSLKLVLEKQLLEGQISSFRAARELLNAISKVFGEPAP
jgi:LAO/AO transport system kinase